MLKNKLKIIISLMFLVTLCATSGFPQTDDSLKLNGVWIQDNKKSLNYMFGVELRETTLKRKNDVCIVKLAVKFVEPKLEVKRTADCEHYKGKKRNYETNSTYYTDGRGETNKIAVGTSRYSKTTLSGRKIITIFYKTNKKGKKEKLIKKKIVVSKKGDKLKVFTNYYLGKSIITSRSSSRQIYKKEK